jgi:hypothetical protein
VVLSVLVAATPRGVAAQPTDPSEATTTFARVASPTGIMVDDEGDVLVLTEPPAGTTLVFFDADGRTLGEQRLETTPPDKFARSRLATIERGPFLGLVALSPGGVVHIELDGLEEPAEIDLAAIEPLEALDLDAAGATTQLRFAGARFDDIAVVPGLPAAPRPGTEPSLDMFVTGVTTTSAGGHPFLVRVTFRPTGEATIRTLATTQGRVADPEHRSGVGTFIPPTDAPPPDRPAVVFAALPSRASAANPRSVDTLVTVGANWPEDPEAEPPGFQTTSNGQPVTLTSPGMTNDSAGNLYAILASDACGEDGSPSGPGVAALTTDGDEVVEACLPLPPPAGQGGRYVDLAVRDRGEPVYVTNERGGVVLRLPGLPVLQLAAGDGPRTALGAAARNAR